MTQKEFKMNNMFLGKILAFLGILPFLLSLALKLTGTSFYGITPQWLFLSYAVVIASFISGIHWGIFLTQTCSRNLFIESNITTLIAWFALLINHKWSLILTLLCFIYLLFIDHALFNSENIPQWYWELRKKITAIVIFIHILFIIILYTGSVYH
tara:strand:- start:183 stop:647 length:465 start_codon:yes stop_codon:yes gene_type:complete